MGKTLSKRQTAPPSKKKASLKIKAKASLAPAADRDIWRRYAIHRSTVLISPGGKDRPAVVIDPDGWRLRPTGDLPSETLSAAAPADDRVDIFFSPEGAFRLSARDLVRPLVKPVNVAWAYRRWRALSGCATSDDFRALFEWVVQAMIPVGPFPLLVLTGPPTHQEALLAQVCDLLDPSAAPLHWPPDGDLCTPDTIKRSFALERARDARECHLALIPSADTMGPEDVEVLGPLTGCPLGRRSFIDRRRRTEPTPYLKDNIPIETASGRIGVRVNRIILSADELQSLFDEAELDEHRRDRPIVLAGVNNLEDFLAACNRAGMLEPVVVRLSRAPSTGGMSPAAVAATFKACSGAILGDLYLCLVRAIDFGAIAHFPDKHMPAAVAAAVAKAIDYHFDIPDHVSEVAALRGGICALVYDKALDGQWRVKASDLRAELGRRLPKKMYAAIPPSNQMHRVLLKMHRAALKGAGVIVSPKIKRERDQDGNQVKLIVFQLKKR